MPDARPDSSTVIPDRPDRSASRHTCTPKWPSRCHSKSPSIGWTSGSVPNTLVYQATADSTSVTVMLAISRTIVIAPPSGRSIRRSWHGCAHGLPATGPAVRQWAGCPTAALRWSARRRHPPISNRCFNHRREHHDLANLDPSEELVAEVFLRFSVVSSTSRRPRVGARQRLGRGSSGAATRPPSAILSLRRVPG